MDATLKRMVLADALGALTGEARSRRAVLPFESAEREFYLGVEAAAAVICHPELDRSRAADWLERETPAFRRGFLATAAEVAALLSSSELPSRVPLPSPG